MLTKASTLKVKAAGPDDGLEEGQFTAYASVFGNVDVFGDVVMKGAFAETIQQWNSSDAELPLLWGHNMSDPDYNIGKVVEASEDDHGLLVRAELDLDGAKAEQVYRLIKGRRVNQMSFAYDIDDAGMAQRDGEDVYELRKLTLHEVSVVPLGANPETELLAVKHASHQARQLANAIKAGRVLSAANETSLRDALGQLEDAAAGIKGVLSAVESDASGNEGKASPAGPANDEDPAEGKSEEPSRPEPVDLSALKHIELAAVAGSDEGNRA